MSDTLSPSLSLPGPNSDTAWLLRVMSAVNRSGSIDQIAAQSLEAIKSRFPFDAAFFLLIDHARSRLIVQHPVCLEPELVAACEQLALPDDFFSSVQREEYGVLALPHLVEAVRRLLAAHGYAAPLILPLQAENRGMGLLALAARDATLDLYAPLLLHNDFLEIISAQLGVALQRAWLAAQLETSEAKFRGLVEHNRDAVWEIEIAGHTTLFNQAMLDLTGYSADELREWTSFVASMQSPLLMRERWNKMLRDGFVQDARVPIRTKSGQFKTINSTAWLSYDQAGRPKYVQMEFRDVTAHVQMEQQLERRGQELHVLNRIAHILSQTIEWSRSINEVFDEIISLTGMEWAAVFGFDPDTRHVRLEAHRQVPAPLLDLYESRILRESLLDDEWVPESSLRFFQHVLQSEEPVALEDLLTSGEWNRPQMGKKGLRSGIAASLRFAGEVFGILVVGSREQRSFNENNSRLVQNIALRLAVSIRNKQLFDGMQARVRELEILSDISSLAGARVPEDNLCNLVLEAIGEWLNLPLVSLNLLEGDRFLPARRRQPSSTLPVRLEMTPLLRQILEARTPFLVDNRHVPEIDGQVTDLLHHSGAAATITVPLWSVNSPLGLLTVGRHDRHAWSDGEVQTIQTIANQLSVAILNARLFQSLEQERRDLQATLDSVFSGVFTTDDQGRILSWNRAAAQITGYDLETVRGRNWTQMVRVGKDMPDELIFEAMDENDIRFGLAPRSFPAFDGHDIPLAEAAAPLLDAEGRIRGAVGAFWDRTKESAAEQARLEFLYEVSHELRNSLTAVIPMADMLRQPDVKGTTRKRAIEIITEQAERLQQFSKRFLSFEHTQLARGQEEQCLDLVPEIQATARLMQAKYPAISLRITGRAHAVYADKPRLQTVLLNLIDNACKYSPRRGRVLIALAEQDNQVQVAIHNSHPPIPPDAFEHLFERGYRAPRSVNGRVPGTGLGLWLARIKLREMGGDVRLENGEKRGVTLILTLERAKGKNEESSENSGDRRRQIRSRRHRPSA